MFFYKKQKEYGSVLSTEISEKPDLNKNPSK